MFPRIFIGRCSNRLSTVIRSFRRRFSSKPEVGETVDIYVAADRGRFYKALGTFCFIQGAVWFGFGRYLFSKRGEAITLSSMKADLDHANFIVASTLESWAPNAIKKYILRSEKSPESAVEKDSSTEPVEETSKAEESEKVDSRSGAKMFSDKVRESFGVVEEKEEKDEKSEDMALKTRLLVPYICFVMGVFTFAIGGFIPRRVIRRISLLPVKQASNQTAVMLPEYLDPPVRVQTYGWFGMIPSKGQIIKTPLSTIRQNGNFKEGNKFMNLVIGKRPFSFYLERYEAEFILPEYMEHLNSTWSKSVKK